MKPPLEDLASVLEMDTQLDCIRAKLNQQASANAEQGVDGPVRPASLFFVRRSLTSRLSQLIMILIVLNWFVSFIRSIYEATLIVLLLQPLPQPPSPSRRARPRHTPLQPLRTNRLGQCRVLDEEVSRGSSQHSRGTFRRFVRSCVSADRFSSAIDRLATRRVREPSYRRAQFEDQHVYDLCPLCVSPVHREAGAWLTNADRRSLLRRLPCQVLARGLEPSRSVSLPPL